MKGAVLLLCLGACLRAQPAGLEGMAVNTAGGQPMSGVHIRVFTANFNGVTNLYGATTDKAGRFAITGISPGPYFIWPERAGFVCMQSSPGALPFPMVTLKPGQRLADFKLEMSPRAVIAGRVVDEFGDPVQNVMIQASPVSPDQATAFTLMQGRSSTDDRGEFRIIGGPGRFHVKATPNPPYQQEIRTDGTTPPSYGPTYYPSASSPETASVVEATAGSDTTGIEIRLANQRTVTITGVITGMPGGPQRPSVMAQSAGSSGYRTAIVDAGGKFSFVPLPPANYRVYAAYSAGHTRMRSQIADVKSDATGVVSMELSLAAGSDVTGRIELPAEVSAGKRTVQLRPIGVFGGEGSNARGEADQDGAFRIPAVLPGKYRVSVQPLPENAYVKTVALDGSAAADDTIELSRGAAGSSVKIVVSGNAARLSGSLLDPDGARLSGGAAMVFLVMKPEEINQETAAHAAPDGSYSFSGIRPGKYRLFAVDLFRTRVADEQDARKFFDIAEEIEIKEGDRIAKDLKVTGKGGADANPKH